MSRRRDPNHRDDLVARTWTLTVVCIHSDRVLPVDKLRVQPGRSTEVAVVAPMGHTNEQKPRGGAKWRGRCGDCGLDVTLSWDRLDKVAEALHDAGVSKVDLRHIPAIVAKQ